VADPVSRASTLADRPRGAPRCAADHRMCRDEALRRPLRGLRRIGGRSSWQQRAPIPLTRTYVSSDLRQRPLRLNQSGFVLLEQIARRICPEVRARHHVLTAATTHVQYVAQEKRRSARVHCVYDPALEARMHIVEHRYPCDAITRRQISQLVCNIACTPETQRAYHVPLIRTQQMHPEQSAAVNQVV